MLLWLIFALIAASTMAKIPETIDDLECDPALPHFSVGDVNLTKDNYETFKKQNSVFLLGLSDSECEKCCYLEPMLGHLKELLSSGRFTYKKKAIPIARIDIKAARGAFATDLPPLNFYPKILLYKQGRYYVYSNYMHYPLILYFINRVLYPTLRLNTTREVEKFLDTTKESPDWSEFYKYGQDYVEIGREMLPQRLIRAIAFISSKSDYKEEIKQITSAAQRLAARDDLRVAFVYNKDTIKKIKSLHFDWFSQYSSTSLILQRYPGDITKFDISTESTDYYYWLTEKSVKEVDKFDRDTMKIYENCVTPIFIMLIDMSPENKKEAEGHINLLKRSAKKYSEFLLYTYANASDEFVKSRKISIDKVPGAVLTFRDGAVIPYPNHWAFDDASLDKFFELYLRRRLNKSESETFQPDYSRETYQELSAVKLLRSATFNSTVLQFGKYVLVFFFSSLNETHEQNKAAAEVNRVAEVIRDLKINDVLVAGFDMSIEPNPMPREKIKPPKVIMAYGEHGMRKLHKYEAPLTADKMLEFMAENSDGKLVYKKEMLKYKGEALYKYYNSKVLPAKKTDL